ncbi:MAG: PilZ domain-containing protein [Kofleriaceae bacterium]|nr:PilZ domain-containing protein [Myxococcales bacterium]MCB9562674.1 PilZ domain-containing protein [Kofleriaceae bacterium]MCB9570994.1 PilZ domain-containing protein [Kofleriaceae bacterium]
MKPRAQTAPSARATRDQRIHIRFDKIFPVVVGSELYGETRAVARNISEGGMLVQMGDPLPLGTYVSIHFQCPRTDGAIDEIVARAEVKHHYCLNFSVPGTDPEARPGPDAASARAIGVRFLDFDDDVPPERLLDGWTRESLLH